MKAQVLEKLKSPLSYKNVPDPIADIDHAVVDLKVAGLNRRDYWITQGLYPGIVTPTILGSDGAGMYNDEAVLINPNIYWGNNPRVPHSNYNILGLESNGTFAEKVLVRKDRVHPIPSHLNFEQAAALPLAGLTAYRALFSNCKLSPGERVLITGIGGGVALMLLKFALATKAEVWVTSSSDLKISKAIALGASGGLNYKQEKWWKTYDKSNGGFDVIIDSGGGKDFNALIALANPGARIGVFGATSGNWDSVKVPSLFFKQISIFGSTMGNDEEFENMLKYVSNHEIIPVVDEVADLKNANELFLKMRDKNQFGKLILNISI